MMGVKTVSVIIPETMNALWFTLRSVHMPVPSVDDFVKISQDFQRKWNFSHCIGAIDGRHVAIKKPPHSGTLYYNFKGYYSIVLQAVIDANYRYICIDVGGYGSQHDSATFQASQLYRAVMHKTIVLPQPSTVENSNLYLPYFFLGDGAYPLSKFLMKPYQNRGNLSEAQKVFNSRLSKARVVVENGFGITSQKFRILLHNIEQSPEIVNLIIKTTCLLHNLIIDLKPQNNVEQVIMENSSDNDDPVLEPVGARDIRDELARYFTLQGW